VLSAACLLWAALEAFDAVLLIGGDLASQWQPGVEAQMGNGREGRLLDVWPEVEFADDPAFVAGVADPSDGGMRRDRRPGVLTSQRILQFRGQACRDRQNVIQLRDQAFGALGVTLLFGRVCFNLGASWWACVECR
jgi:hypothetical protein